MLDPWIIEEIKRREQRSKIEEQPRVEIPIQGPERDRDRDRTRDRRGPAGHNEEEKPPRGVTIIDYGVACW
jgi:hypothetical protein